MFGDRPRSIQTASRKRTIIGSTASSAAPAVASVAARTEVEDFIAALMEPALLPVADGRAVAGSRTAGWCDRMQTQYGLPLTGSNVTRLTDPHDH